MRAKKLLMILAIFCLSAVFAMAASGCNAGGTADGSDTASISDTSSEKDTGGSSSEPSSGEEPTVPDPAERYTLSFSGLDGSYDIVVTKGKVIGILPSVPEKDGFYANGWKIGEDKITASTVWRYSSNKKAEPIYTSGTAEYTVEHWFEDVATGEYVKDDLKTQHCTGVIDTKAASVSLDMAGYEKDSAHIGSKEVGTVKSDGSLVLKVYYSLKRYTVNFVTNLQPEWESVTIKHGAKLPALPDPQFGELSFDGWFVAGQEFDVTSVITSDVTLLASYSGVVSIDNEAEFLNIGQDYPEFLWDRISYELNADLEFDTDDFTYENPSDIVIGTSSSGTYLVKELGMRFDGKGHRITVDYENKRDSSLIYPAVFDKVSSTLKNVYFELHIKSLGEISALARSVTATGRVEDCYIDAEMLINSVDMYPGFYGYRSAVIHSNKGAIERCVFKIYSKERNEAQTATLAVRFQYGTLSDCSVISSTVWSEHRQFISSNYGAYHELQTNPAGNTDPNRSNCYLFDDIASLKSGNGYKYNDDGSVTEGTYTSVKNLYTGSYWDAWLV